MESQFDSVVCELPWCAVDINVFVSGCCQCSKHVCMCCCCCCYMWLWVRKQQQQQSVTETKGKKVQYFKKWFLCWWNWQSKWVENIFMELDAWQASVRIFAKKLYYKFGKNVLDYRLIFCQVCKICVEKNYGPENFEIL